MIMLTLLCLHRFLLVQTMESYRNLSDNAKESAGAKNTVANEDSNDWDVWHGACAKSASRSDDKVKKVAANDKELFLANMKALFDFTTALS
jgi:hypothetical protein